MTRINKRSAVLIPISVMCALGLTQGQAQNWEFVPDVDLAASRVDNPRLDPDDTSEDASNRLVLDGKVRAQNYGERGYIYLEPRIRADIYRDDEDSDLDGDDLFLRAAGQYRWEAALLGFRVNANQMSILRSEIVDALPDDLEEEDPIDVETGELVSFDEDRTRITTNAFTEFRLSERSSFRFSGRITTVDYSGPPISNRSDFDSNEISAGLVRRVDERTRVTARVFTQGYEADLNANSTDSVGVEGQFTRPLSETWTFTLTAGVQRNEFSFVEGTTVVDNADTNPTYGLAFRNRAERTAWNIDLLRRVNPNGSGFVVVRDEFRVFVDRDLTPRLSGRVGLRYFETGTVGDVRQGSDREDIRLESRLEWAITPRFLLNGGINYTSREFLNTGSDSDSNEIYVGVTYRGLSRQRRRR